MHRLVSSGVTTLAALVVAVGCGGSSTSDGDDAGKGGSGGGGGSASHPPAAGLAINLTPPIVSEVPAAAGRTCTAGGVGAWSYAVGAPKPHGTVANGAAGVGVACTVTGSGSIDGSVSGPEEQSHQPLSFDVLGTVTNTFEPTSAKISFYAPDTLTLQVLDGFPDCTLDHFDVLKAGAVLADFTCPLLASATDASAGCH